MSAHDRISSLKSFMSELDTMKIDAKKRHEDSLQRLAQLVDNHEASP